MTTTVYDETKIVDEAADKTVAEHTPQSHFLRAVWRWHFYAGLFTVPFLIMLSITGIIYLFRPQLDALMYRQQLFVTPAATALPYSAQLKAAQQVYPGAEIASITPNRAPNRSSEVVLTSAEGRQLRVFVDPYTNQVLGEQDEENNLQALVMRLHGELMLGTTGDYIIELAACWAIVLVVTGLYLWWPRQRLNLWGTLLPRLFTKNRRIFWRDLHAVPGFWGALVVLFMVLTGLPWAGFWGGKFAQPLLTFPAAMWDAVPVSTPLVGALNTSDTKVVPWAVEQLPLPQSTQEEHQNHQPGTEPEQPAKQDGHLNHQHGTEAEQPVITPVAGTPPGAPVTLDSVIALAHEQGAPAGFTVSLPVGEEGVYTISAFPDDVSQEMTLHVDQYSGEILADVRWQDYSLGAKGVELGISLHEGRYFGFWNQMLMLFASLVTLILPVTGTIMWWQRRPAGRLGVPAMPKNFPVWKGAVAIMAVLGVCFPLVGISLIVVLLLDYLLISRIPQLKALVGA